MKKNNKAFTLVELIVVITILAILATIGFVSFSGYLAGTRDTNRIAQLKSMSDALELYRTKKDLPIPDDKIDIKANTKTIAYQGYIGKNVLETIEYTESGLDPKDKTYFSYYLTKNKKYFQLLAFLEEENEDVVAFKPHPNPLLKGEGIIGKSFATDYSDRYPKTTGKKLGILTGTGTDLNKPVQEILTGSLDIATTTDEYVANFSDISKLSGTGAKLVALANTTKAGGIASSCKTLLDRRNSLKGNDGTYIIDPEGNNPFPVYCDMTTDGGGWTLYTAKAKHGFPDTGYITANTILNNTSYENIMWKYVSPNGKKLPLIYKLFNQKEGRLLLSHWKIKQTEWTNNILHYSTTSDFANAIKIGDGNTSGVTTSQIKNAINLDNKRFFTARVDGNGDDNIHMGTAFRSWSNTKNYLYFPTTPYNSTYRIGTETFNYISNTGHWTDGRSISIFIR